MERVKENSCYEVMAVVLACLLPPRIPWPSPLSNKQLLPSFAAGRCFTQSGSRILIFPFSAIFDPFRRHALRQRVFKEVIPIYQSCHVMRKSAKSWRRTTVEIGLFVGEYQWQLRKECCVINAVSWHIEHVVPNFWSSVIRTLPGTSRAGDFSDNSSEAGIDRWRIHT